MALYGVQSCMVLYGLVLTRLVLYGPVWSYTVLYGLVQSKLCDFFFCDFLFFEDTKKVVVPHQ